MNWGAFSFFLLGVMVQIGVCNIWFRLGVQRGRREIQNQLEEAEDEFVKLMYNEVRNRALKKIREDALRLLKPLLPISVYEDFCKKVGFEDDNIC